MFPLRTPTLNNILLARVVLLGCIGLQRVNFYPPNPRTAYYCVVCLCLVGWAPPTPFLLPSITNASKTKPPHLIFITIGCYIAAYFIACIMLKSCILGSAGCQWKPSASLSLDTLSFYNARGQLVFPASDYSIVAVPWSHKNAGRFQLWSLQNYECSSGVTLYHFSLS